MRIKRKPQANKETREAATEILERALDILKDPKHWIRGYLAKKNTGLTFPEDPDATSFCMLGAIQRAAGEIRMKENLFTVHDAQNEAREILQDCIDKKSHIDYGGIAGFNDHRNTRHSRVIGVLECAIEEAKKGG